MDARTARPHLVQLACALERNTDHARATLIPMPSGRGAPASENLGHTYVCAKVGIDLPIVKRAYTKRAPGKRRQCLGCGLFVAANTYATHRRGDACKGRPTPTPVECEVGHGRAWPCLLCELVTLLALAFRPEEAAERMGVSLGKVEREIAEMRRRLAPRG